MRVSKVIYIFMVGILSGIFISQGLVVLAHRTGWNFGGEVIILPLIFLLIYLGFMIGRMHTEMKDYEDAFEEGYYEGMADTRRRLQDGK